MEMELVAPKSQDVGVVWRECSQCVASVVDVCACLEMAPTSSFYSHKRR